MISSDKSPRQFRLFSNHCISLCGTFLVLLLWMPAAYADPPVANAVFISPPGPAESGDTLTGNYTYSDADDPPDPQGTSTFLWLRNGSPTGVTTQSYQLTNADQGTTIRFEVTPVAQTPPGELIGDPVQSAGTSIIANAPPVATAVDISPPWPC